MRPTPDHRLAVLLLLLLLLGACDEDQDGGEPPGDDDAVEELDLSAFSVQVIRSPSEIFLDLAWRDEQSLAGLEFSQSGEMLCPDCVDIPLEDCPEECERDLLDLWLLGHDGAEIAPPARVVTYFPPAFDHDLGLVQVVPLWDGNLGLVWQECDNSVCGGVFAARSCTARYQRVAPDGTALTDAVALYEGWFGDVELVASASAEQLLVVHSTMIGCFGGVQVALFDIDGAPLSGFTPLGSIQGNVPAAAVHDGAFVVALDDPEPTDPPAAPCANSCECGCGGFPSTSGEDAGLSAYWIDGAGAATREVITSSAQGDEIAWYQQLQLRSQGESLVVAGVPSSLPVTVRQRGDDGLWSPRYSHEAPGSLWFDLQATPSGDVFWVGSDATDPDGDYLMTELVVGATAADGIHGRGPIEDPLRGYVFDFAVTGGSLADGCQRVFLLRGVFPEEPSGEWDRFEVVRIDATPDW